MIYVDEIIKIIFAIFFVVVSTFYMALSSWALAGHPLKATRRKPMSKKDISILEKIEIYIEAKKQEILDEYNKNMDEEWLSHAFPYLDLQVMINKWREQTPDKGRRRIKNV